MERYGLKILIWISVRPLPKLSRYHYPFTPWIDGSCPRESHCLVFRELLRVKTASENFPWTSHSGGSRGGARGAAPLFLDQNEARRAKKFGGGQWPPPLLPYLKVWICHCLKHNKTRCGWGASMVDLSLWTRWGIQSEVSQSWSSYMYLTVEITLCMCGMYSSFIWWREIIKIAKKNPRSDTRYLNFSHWSRACFAKKSNVATNIDAANN